MNGWSCQGSNLMTNKCSIPLYCLVSLEHSSNEDSVTIPVMHSRTTVPVASISTTYMSCSLFYQNIW